MISCFIDIGSHHGLVFRSVVTFFCCGKKLDMLPMAIGPLHLPSLLIWYYTMLMVLKEPQLECYPDIEAHLCQKLISHFLLNEYVIPPDIPLLVEDFDDDEKEY